MIMYWRHEQAQEQAKRQELIRQLPRPQPEPSQFPPGDERLAVTILLPKSGSTVSESEIIKGQIYHKGWPVVLVKPLTPNEAWWVQQEVEEVVGVDFTALARFGLEESQPSYYRIVVILTKGKETAHKYELGSQLKALPPGLPRSDSVVVLRP
jgi:hypothetical protein